MCQLRLAGWLFAAIAVVVPLLASCAEAAGNVREVNNVENLHPRTTFDLHADLEVGEAAGKQGANALYVFNSVYDIGVDSCDRLYVVDNGAARVEVFDSLGTYVRTIGQSGNRPGEYRYASAIAFDADDNAYVADLGKIIVYGRDGRFLRELKNTSDSFVRRLRVGRGNLYIASLNLFDQRIIHTLDLRDGKDRGWFCDSYAVGQRIDTRVETAIAGGTFDINKGVIYYSQLNPYEIRMFTLDGNQTTVVYRNNDFIEEPIVEVEKDGGMHFEPLASSTSIVALNNGPFLNVATAPAGSADRKTIIDLFDASGALLSTVRLDGIVLIKCRDQLNRLYAVDLRGITRIARYRITIK